MNMKLNVLAWSLKIEKLQTKLQNTKHKLQKTDIKMLAILHFTHF